MQNKQLVSLLEIYSPEIFIQMVKIIFAQYLFNEMNRLWMHLN